MLAASDILLLAASALATFYCITLSRRLRNLASLEGEIGQAIALLSKEVDELSKATSAARQSLAGPSETAEIRAEKHPPPKRVLRYRKRDATAGPNP